MIEPDNLKEGIPKTIMLNPTSLFEPLAALTPSDSRPQGQIVPNLSLLQPSRLEPNVNLKLVKHNQKILKPGEFEPNENWIKLNQNPFGGSTPNVPSTLIEAYTGLTDLIPNQDQPQPDLDANPDQVPDVCFDATKLSLP